MRAVVHVHCTLLESILILGVGMRHVGLVFALMVLWFLSTVSAAQTGASLSGVVTDQTGAALRDVAVTVKNVDTGATRTITTDDGGKHPRRLRERPRVRHHRLRADLARHHTVRCV